MKKLFIIAVSVLVSITAVALPVPKQSNDTIIVLTVAPPMHCANCEKKIKSNIRFEKGVKSIVTDRDKQTVTIKADKSKLNIGSLETAFAKIGYKAAVCQK